MVTYELSETSFGKVLILRHNENGTIDSFTEDPANSDYRRYLRWLENPEAEEFAATITE